MYTAKQPNIILFVTDDQGYGDLSCMGSTDVCTPNLDNLAARGVRYTSYYAASPVCSPSRVGLLTGTHPYRTGVRAILGGMKTAEGINPGTTTIASALKELGYDTAMVGKWHLGAVPESRPTHMGFDSFTGWLSGVNDYFSHIHYTEANCFPGVAPHLDMWENDERTHKHAGHYSTELFTEKALDFVRAHADSEKPFFLYVAYNAPHYPMHAPYKYLSRFDKRLPWDRAIMAAMLSAVDDGVGEIVNELKRQGIFENTIIHFQSDNCPSREARCWMDERKDFYYGGSTGGLKGHKFSLFEGGIRVPGITCWPDKIPGGQIVDTPISALDFFPTVYKAAGGDVDKLNSDGCDILPVLADGAPNPHEYMFWEMGMQTAVRKGNYKLVINGYLREGWDLPLDPMLGTNIPLALYDMSKDMSEEHNLAEEMPELAQELKEIALNWRANVEEYWKTHPKAAGQLSPDDLCTVMQASIDYE